MGQHFEDQGPEVRLRRHLAVVSWSRNSLLEFLDMLDLAPANGSTLGDIAVTPIGRPGTLLDLVAFIGGDDGDVGVKIGTLGVTVVPEPSSLSLLLLATAAMFAVAFLRASRQGASE